MKRTRTILTSVIGGVLLLAVLVLGGCGGGHHHGHHMSFEGGHIDYPIHGAR